MNEVHSARTRLPMHLFSRRRDSICAACVHLNQTTPLFQLSRALRTLFALDQTSDDFPCARHARRSDQRQIRVACGKRLVTTPTDHLASTNQTTCLPEDRPVAPGGSRQDGSDLETSALPCPGRRRCFAGIVSSSACSGSINQRYIRESQGSRLRQSP